MTILMNSNFKNQVEQRLRRFFDLKIKALRDVDVIAAELCGAIKDFTLNGGKRIRALLIWYGYQSAGGKNPKVAIRMAAAFELMHSFLLIHDDVIDRSDTRRFQKTIHVAYRDDYKKLVKGNPGHFGNSMGILAGDLALSLAYEILDQANKEIRNSSVIEKINQIIQQTIIGEALDVVYSNIPLDHPNSGQNKDESIIHKIHLLKTAKYTVEGPLHTGLILAGANKKILNKFSKFSIPLGIAYQIKDDIDGVFGEEKKVGKSVVSDIQEGKLTLLIAQALEKSNSQQKKFLKNILGSNIVTKKDLEKVKDIMIKTEALKYSQEKISELTKKARHALTLMKLKNDNFLYELIDYLEK